MSEPLVPSTSTVPLPCRMAVPSSALQLSGPVTYKAMGRRRVSDYLHGLHHHMPKREADQLPRLSTIAGYSLSRPTFLFSLLAVLPRKLCCRRFWTAVMKAVQRRRNRFDAIRAGAVLFELGSLSSGEL